MKQVAILGERQAGLIDTPDPEPKENWVVVKIEAAPMCTEYKLFLSGYNQTILGHEAAGEVVAVAQSSRLKVGDRVVVMPLYACGRCELCLAGDYIYCENNYDFSGFTGATTGCATMAQYILKPDWLLPKIPDDISYERASLACCALGPSFGALQTMGVTAFDTILISGAGPVGLGAIVNARFRGARVIVAESVPWRVERALQMGAAAVIDPRSDEPAEQIKTLTGGRGVDSAIECSGTVQAERLCIDATRRRGKVAFVGECNDALKLYISPDMIRKGLTLAGSWHYNIQHFPLIMKVIRESPLLDLLASHVFPMSQIQAAFELQTTGQSAKVILKPWE